MAGGSVGAIACGFAEVLVFVGFVAGLACAFPFVCAHSQHSSLSGDLQLAAYLFQLG